jgi:catechol 2,3-dioxygenase-like lactoylglutathione lyase family enzyme
VFDHVSIKVKDLIKSKTFYEKAFLPLGYKISFGKEGLYAFDIGNHCLFEIIQHHEKTAITSTHVAFRAATHEKVNAFYTAALDAGAKDNGELGPRPQYTKQYYACFILDPDGHNIEVMHDVY